MHCSRRTIKAMEINRPMQTVFSVTMTPAINTVTISANTCRAQKMESQGKEIVAWFAPQRFGFRFVWTTEMDSWEWKALELMHFGLPTQPNWFSCIPYSSLRWLLFWRQFVTGDHYFIRSTHKEHWLFLNRLFTFLKIVLLKQFLRFQLMDMKNPCVMPRGICFRSAYPAYPRMNILFLKAVLTHFIEKCLLFSILESKFKLKSNSMLYFHGEMCYDWQYRMIFRFWWYSMGVLSCADGIFEFKVDMLSLVHQTWKTR